MNPHLPGLSQTEVVLVSEKNSAIHSEAFPYCYSKCVRSFTEEGYPYFPGEKTCMDRCMSKIAETYNIALSAASSVEEKRKNGGMVALGSWVSVLDQVHKRKS